MAFKLTWDGDGDRIYETGVDQVALYLLNGSTYGDGVAWNGISGITESPEGADANDIYADNIKYLSLISAENWKGTIKGYSWPSEYNECQGEWEYNDGTNRGVFFGQQIHKKFGLVWRTIEGNDTEGDAYGYKIHLAYGLTAAPSEKDHATKNDSPEATEFSWEINSIPANVTKKLDMVASDTKPVEIKPVSHIVISSRDNSELYEWIEGQVYGSDDDPATLPSPDDIIDKINELVNT